MGTLHVDSGFDLVFGFQSQYCVQSGATKNYVVFKKSVCCLFAKFGNLAFNNEGNHLKMKKLYLETGRFCLRTPERDMITA